MRGGEPLLCADRENNRRISPTCVGVNRLWRKGRRRIYVISPTCVGVNRNPFTLSIAPAYIPHMRGGEPQYGVTLELMKFISPTCVGVNRGTASIKLGIYHIPHMRGGEPSVKVHWSKQKKISPTCVGVNRLPSSRNSLDTKYPPHAWG